MVEHPTHEGGRPKRPTSSMGQNMEFAHPGTGRYVDALERYADDLEAQLREARAVPGARRAQQPTRRYGETVGIKIDTLLYALVPGTYTGSELRYQPTPPVRDEYDLYEQTPFDGDDRIVQDDEAIEIKGGEHFFTAPQTINASGASA